MPFFLPNRDTDSIERMDDPDCDIDELENTYRQFYIVNSLISRWRYIYKKIIRPRLFEMEGSGTLLDIGFGGGDIPVKLARWSSEDNFELAITAIDTDERALEFIEKQEHTDGIRFMKTSSTKLLQNNQQFDFVVSNHLLHHVDTDDLHILLSESRNLSRRMVIFNDIERSDIGYLLFNLISRPIFRSSFITQDGLTSIKRSYTLDELSEAVPDNWQVRRLFPFRLLLTYTHGSTEEKFL